MSEVQQLYLDDLRVGQRFTSGSYLMEAARIKQFAAEFDPQPFHLDEASAGASVLKDWRPAAGIPPPLPCGSWLTAACHSLMALSASAEKSPGPSPRGQAILCKSKAKLSKSRRRVRSRSRAS